MFAEIIYETGTKSVGEYDSEAELLVALKTHQLRAVGGQEGGPSGHRAERIKRVEIYDRHPSELNEVQVVGTDVARKQVEALLTELDAGGSISVVELAQRIRELPSPLVVDAGAHESMYKMPAVRVLEKGWEVDDA